MYVVGVIKEKEYGMAVDDVGIGQQYFLVKSVCTTSGIYERARRPRYQM